MNGSEGTLIWLKWRVVEGGGVQVVETREVEGETVRRRRDADSLDAAAERYGDRFREVVETVLDSGSRQGRYRP